MSCRKIATGIQHAAEAIAMDEDRSFFPMTNVTAAKQRWFRGTHSDVGGGWADHRLSDVALQWMLGEAQTVGVSLDLNKTLAETYKGQGLTFTPDPTAPINANQGFTSWFTVLGTIDRTAAMFEFAMRRGVTVEQTPLLNAYIMEFAFSFAVFGVL